MSVTAPKGFVAAGVAAGIKASGRPDLSLVATADRQPVAAAGVFTTNLVAAAPVQLSRRHLAAEGRAAAVVLNSGNANAATGEPGLLVAEGTAALVADALGCDRRHVLVCSTGLIGIPMTLEPFTTGVRAAAAALGATPEAGHSAAEAIMTTDTVAKEALATFDAGGTTVTVGGMAKGAAMLSPAMATMLAVITTDAAVEPRALQLALTRAVDASFNLMSTDGSRSTNDTVLVLAGGAAGNPSITAGSPEAHALADALTAVCASLSDQMAHDAEGATKFVRLTVKGARSNGEALQAARAVAESQLVKCSLFGGDPYWGRILSELGASGAYLDPDRVDIAYNDITVCVGGVAADVYDVEALAKSMQQKEIEVTADLGLGNGEATVTTVDLTPGYIDENMRTS
ncbi:MAG TPA: bifunctional glutamate N-acetyltransferase/amino-acid acetyltransferase ArgJ [Acidimicrobiia bacterium]|jgi:glutamate N-acetyltransferase/amino-acid N-acetyltransferase|nr:bifunctional glutamate N-acetyltransferase/amino-acid acetyltransferase ArgJ [Acidimicrobiia bacterium]